MKFGSSEREEKSRGGERIVRKPWGEKQGGGSAVPIRGGKVDVRGVIRKKILEVLFGKYIFRKNIEDGINVREG
jgi:hypothetical protein